MTLISKYVKYEKELVDISLKNSINGKSTEPEKQQERDLALYKTRTRYEIAQNLLLSSILDRFTVPTDIDIKEYGYRLNNEIVLVRNKSIAPDKAKIANAFILHVEPSANM